MEAGGGVLKAKLGRRGQNPDLFGGGAESTEPGNGLNKKHEVKRRIKKNYLVSGSTDWVHENHHLLHH